jgi:hypothetical protein
MVSISLQLAEKPITAEDLDDQEDMAGGSAHGQAEHGAVAPELLNDAVGFGAHGWCQGWSRRFAEPVELTIYPSLQHRIQAAVGLGG